MPHMNFEALRRLRSLPRRCGFPFVMIALAVAALSGCASGPSASASNIRYDLGAPPDIGTPGTLPPVKVVGISAPRDLDSDAFVYRLQYADAQRTGVYSNSHWTMPPAHLLTQRLRAALAARGPVLTGADTVRAPLLEVELIGFEQVFDAPSESHGARLGARDALAAGPRDRPAHVHGARAGQHGRRRRRRAGARRRLRRTHRADDRMARRAAARRVAMTPPSSVRTRPAARSGHR